MAQIGLTTLPNGVRVVSERFAASSVALSVRVRAGARDDPKGQEGISHLLEHMLLRGSKGYPAEAIAATSDRIGDRLTLSTTHEETVLEWLLLPRQLRRGLEMLADMVLRPDLEDLEVEREVVLTEMADEEDDNEVISHAISSQAVFGPHPLARRVIGTRQAVASIDPDDLRRHHARHYVGGGIVVAAAGDVRHRDLVSLVRRLFGAAPPCNPPRRSRPSAPSIPYNYRSKTATERYSLAFAAPGVSSSSPLLPPCLLLMDALANLESSLLWKELRTDRGLVYDVRGWVGTFSDAGQLDLSLTTAPETARRARRVVRETLEHFQEEGPGHRLALAYESRLARQALYGPEDRADAIGEQVMQGLVPKSAAQTRREWAAVDERAVRRALKLFDPSRFSVIGLLPDK